MTTTRRRAGGAILGLVLLTTACSEGGGLAISNESSHLVTVQLGDEETEISSGGGVVVHDYGCSPGDVVVVSASGEATTINGPVCSDRRIMIDRAGDVTVAPAETVG